MFRQLDDKVLIAGQIAPADVAEAVTQGVTTIINNRPDGEAPGQPAGTDIAAAAAGAGVDYLHIPVAGGLSESLVQQLGDALAKLEGKALLFCASGTRSAYLWALAEAKTGSDPDVIIGKAAGAGYDVSALRPYLEAFRQAQGAR